MPRQPESNDSQNVQTGRAIDVPAAVAGVDGVRPSVAAGTHRGTLIVPTKLLIPAAIVFLLSLPIFARLAFIGVGPGEETTDYRLHVALALDMVRKGAVLPHPLFHGLLLVLIGGDNTNAAPGMVAFLLAAAMAARAYLTAGMLSSSRGLSTVTLTVLCLALAIVMPLPNWWNWPNVCRLQVAPNAWYNPTGVFAMPFALALFALGMRALDSNGWGPYAALSAAMVLSLLAKPNYVLAFAPCFAIMLAMTLYRSIRDGRLTATSSVGKAALVFGPTVLILALQYLILYGGADPAGGRLVYTQVQLWQDATRHHVAAAIYLGVAFPLVVTVLYPRAANEDRALVLAWAVQAVGILHFALFMETGSRMIHFNLSWGMMLAAYVLFVVSCAFLLRQPRGVRRWIAFGVLGLQVASGCMCLVRSLNEPWNAITF